MASPYYTVIYPQFNATQTNFGSLVPAGGDKGNLFKSAGVSNGAAVPVLRRPAAGKAHLCPSFTTPLLDTRAFAALCSGH
jgi:hypothetical protein